jgi:uncharacterized membrane protein
MQSKARIFGHPLHPMLVPFPIAFYTATLIACIVYGSTDNTLWFRVALIMNCGGVIGAAVAMLPGIIDWVSISQGTEAKATGLKHMVANVFSTGFFVASAVVMYTNLSKAHPPIQSNIVLAVFGFLVMLYAGFKGWDMVQKHHMGVNSNSDEQVTEQNEPEKNATEIFSDTKEKPNGNPNQQRR